MPSQGLKHSVFVNDNLTEHHIRLNAGIKEVDVIFTQEHQDIGNVLAPKR